MTLSSAQRERVGSLLRRAEQDTQPIAPLSQTFQGLDLADAYAIQRHNIARRLVDGSRVVGHKVGLTAAAMQQLLGVDEPDFGHLLDDMVRHDRDVVAASALCAPRIEPEICFRLGAQLRGPGITAQDVLAATEAVAPALEIVDSRIRDWDITLADTVADNASSAGLVHGPWTALEDAPDLAGISVDLLIDGEVTARGTGAEVLGHPAAAVAWLANTLASFDAALEPGQLVLPGAMTTAPFVHAGHKVEALFAGLGSVSVTFS